MELSDEEHARRTEAMVVEKQLTEQHSSDR